MSIINTINLVRCDINKRGFPKGEKNSDLKYAFRGIDELYNLISPIMSEHGLVIVPTVTESSVAVVGQSKYGVDLWKATVNVNYTVYHIHGDDSINLSFVGEANDYSDKATNKATTSAFKYMMIQLFDMPIVGTDNDADASNMEGESLQLNAKDDNIGDKIKLLIPTVNIPENYIKKVEESLKSDDPVKLERLYKYLNEKCEKKGIK